MLDAAGVRYYMDKHKMIGGSEHRVAHVIAAGRVLKDLDAHAIATESIYDYLTDQQLANHFFGDDIRVEGFYQHLGRLHIITSQPFVKGTHPTWPQLKAGLVNQGFVDPSPHGQSGSFILPHPDLGQVDVIDLHTNNAVLGADGSIHPIDVHFYFDSHADRVKALQSLGLQP
jgi:hypothetical protein